MGAVPLVAGLPVSAPFPGAPLPPGLAHLAALAQRPTPATCRRARALIVLNQSQTLYINVEFFTFDDYLLRIVLLNGYHY